ncbi:MAG: alpha/beta fold hydrolase [Accumulibacter sp.]|jgi:pimeloyl-ACP methyl ester esterase|uniref:alpha/beta fold hydrolase n=1 Tax=Accumulibacter sp. TaxID=2053492 RepID=UPI002FC31AA1
MTMLIGQVPDLALVHGWGLGRAVWQTLLAPLSRSCRVYPVDLPGYGQLPASGADFTETARNLIDALPASVILCGWSLGAMLAMRAALLAPQRVAGLVLVGATASFIQRDDWQQAQAPELLDSFSESIRQQPEQALQRFVGLLNQGDGQARALGRTLRAGLRTGRLPDPETLRRGLDWLRDIDLRSLLPKIATPSLLIHGDQDPLNPLAAAKALAQVMPNARLAVFAGAAHAPFLADPDRFVALLDDFCHARTAL